MRCKLVGALDCTLDDRGLADPIGGPVCETESRVRSIVQLFDAHLVTVANATENT